MFTIEHPKQGIIIHHFRDVGHAELTLPNLSTASKHEPREPWHEIPENIDPFLSVNHHLYPEDHVLSFEIKEDGDT